jgi:hypothetical protein
VGGYGPDSSDLGQTAVAGLCEHDKESLALNFLIN